ncbi:MAG TPA: hypothetical protein PK999_11275, partial [Nitrospira sp.]|nr:hypothetical protein [Nitrospira sp.]
DTSHLFTAELNHGHRSPSFFCGRRVWNPSIIVAVDMKEPHQPEAIDELVVKLYGWLIRAARGSESSVRKAHRIVRKRAEGYVEGRQLTENTLSFVGG